MKAGSYSGRNASEDLAAGLSEYLLRHLPAGQRTGAEGALLQNAVCGLLAGLQQGHACVPLGELFRSGATEARLALLRSGLASVDGASPLILDHADRLYFYRYYHYERRLAEALRSRLQLPPTPLSAAQAAVLRDEFQRNRESLPAQEIDWQLVAAALALSNRLTVISGGPGTGKTRTVAAILLGLLSADPRLRIVLCAPTGKAAGRLQASLQARLSEFPETLHAALPTEAVTVHRLIGLQSHSSRPRYDRNRLLLLDVLIVDEASMIDLALASKLLDAVPLTARVILLGDKDQLAAVEAGSVFNTLSAQTGWPVWQSQMLQEHFDITPPGRGPDDSGAVPAGFSVWLQRSYRFGQDSAIGRFALAVRDQTLDPETLSRWSADAAGDVQLRDCPVPVLSDALLNSLADEYADFIAVLQHSDPDPQALLQAFDACRILCALRHGPRGTELLNAELGRLLQRRSGLAPRRNELWYRGRPIMIAGNDYSVKLFNGEVGIALPNPAGRYDVWFPAREGGVRAVPAARLPGHETTYCTTVHKAQGSEYPRVSFVLPAEAGGILSRELIYTAITRAMQSVRIIGSVEVLCAGVRQRTQRYSGLPDRLAAAGE